MKWTMECQAAFKKLKCLFATEPVLKYPDPNAPFIIQVDTNDVVVKAVLLQRNSQGALQPCSYTSKKITDTEWQWAVWGKEAYAVR